MGINLGPREEVAEENIYTKGIKRNKIMEQSD